MTLGAEWLLTGEPARRHGSFSIANDCWTAEISEEPLGGGLRLYSVDGEVRESMSVELQGRSDPALCFSSFVNAPVHMASRDGLTLDLTHGETLAYRLAGNAATFGLSPTRRFQHLGVSISHEGLLEFLEGEFPDWARPFLAERQERSLVRFVMPPASMGVLHRTVFAKPLTGALARLHREAAARLVLAEVMGQFGSEGEGPALTAREERLVQEAHARLLASLIDPPDLADLAAALGISRRRLAFGLRQRYGGSAFDLVRDARLEHARAILAETDLPLKEVAWRVGYAHASNFVKAFTRRFGEPPRRLLAGQTSNSPN